jgi:hypothetical protein
MSDENSHNTALTARKPRGPGRRFEKGNPRRRPGTRNKATVLAERLLGEDLEAVVAVVRKAALEGDMVACRLIIERLIPALKTRRVVFPMEPINSVDDIVEAYRGLWDACAQGILSPDETATLAGVLKDHAAVLEAKDLEARIARLEAAAVKFAGRGFGRGFGPGFWGYYGYDNGLWWNPDYGDYTYCY